MSQYVLVMSFLLHRLWQRNTDALIPIGIGSMLVDECHHQHCEMADTTTTTNNHANASETPMSPLTPHSTATGNAHISAASSTSNNCDPTVTNNTTASATLPLVIPPPESSSEDDDATSTDDNTIDNNNNSNYRQGTTASARFNIWSTMVGGGSLSLPLAFHKAGNLFVAPLLLIGIAALSEICFGMLIAAARTMNQGNNTNYNLNNATRNNHLGMTAANNNNNPESGENDNIDDDNNDNDDNTVVDTTPPGTDSYESIARAALGEFLGYQLSMALVTFMCFFGTIGYAVLLRDMLVPVNDAIFGSGGDGGGGNHTVTPNGTLPDFLDWDSRMMMMTTTLWEDADADTAAASSAPTWRDNYSMLLVVVATTPLCTLRTLTALKKFGAASMCSVGILGLCILYRSLECHFHLLQAGDWAGLAQSFQFGPNGHDGNSMIMDLLDVFPLFVSCFVCHYNIPTVHNEFQRPTPKRVHWWLRSTVWGATAFYAVMGVAGSAYSHCAQYTRNANNSDGSSIPHQPVEVAGNILLDFPETDPLLLVGRLCLAVTLTLAFPMLTIPARDIVLRLILNRKQQNNLRNNSNENGPLDVDETLRDRLLSNDYIDEEVRLDESATMTAIQEEEDSVVIRSTAMVDVEAPSTNNSNHMPSWNMRLGVATGVFWSAAAVASCVRSIDIVWDLLGSSLSMLLSYLIPCGSYLILMKSGGDGAAASSSQQQRQQLPSRAWIILAWAILVVASPLMVVSTANAIYNTFFQEDAR